MAKILYANYEYEEDAGTADKVNVTALKRLAELQKNNKEKQTKPTVETIEIRKTNQELVKLGDAVDIAKDAWSKVAGDVNDAIIKIGDKATEILLIPGLEAEIKWLEADLTYWGKVKEVGNKEAATARIPQLKAEIKKIKADIKHIKANPNKLIYDNRAPKVTSTENNSNKISELENEIEILEDIKPNTIKAENLLNKQIQEKKDQLKLLVPGRYTKQESSIPDISTVQLLESGAAYEQGGVAKVYAVGHYSKSQWIEISKKLGVLPDVC